MPSQSLLHWNGSRKRELDEIESALQAVGGAGQGQPSATQQLIHAYAVLLASQFQGFCRDLTSECVGTIVDALSPPALRPIIRSGMTSELKLDPGNARPETIHADFARLGVPDIWMEMHRLDPRTTPRKAMLVDLNRWRNAIAHKSFNPAKLGGSTNLMLPVVRNWRDACDELARTLDTAMNNHIIIITKGNRSRPGGEERRGLAA